MNRLNRTVCILFCINLVLCALASRLGPIMEPGVLHTFFEFFAKYVLPGSIGLTFLLSSFSLFLKSPKLFVILSLVSAAILLHSFAHIYWPSLRFGVPIQDYLLSDTVSANYSFAAAKLYLKNTLFFLLPSLVFLQNIEDADSKLLRSIGITLLLVLVPNAVVALIQGAWNMGFLSQGSGTAVPAGRAAGLLEDGGASAVYFALLASGFLSVFLLARLSVRAKVLSSALLVLAVAAGIMSRGRAFFICFLLAAFCIFCLFLFRYRGGKSLALALIFPFACFLILKFAPVSLNKSFAHFPDVKISELANPDYLSRVFLQVDPIRPVHIKAMLAAFLEHPWKGTGLGFFYANLFEHQASATAQGGILFADPPELYPMILSEWGLAGILILMLLALAFARKIILMVKKYEHDTSVVLHIEILDCFMLGLSLALLASFWIGIHLIFQSVASLAGIVFAWIIWQETTKRFRFFYSASIFTFLSLLLAGTLFQWWTAPRSPAFRWEARAKAQVPLSLPLGEKNEFAEKGTWLSSGGELLLSQNSLRFLVKRPKEFYPVEVRTYLYDATGLQRFAYSNSLAVGNEEGDVVTVEFESEFVRNCVEHNSPEHFCSVRIFVEPKWKVKEHKVGVYVYASSLEAPHS